MYVHMLVLTCMCACLLQSQAQILCSPVLLAEGTQWHLRVLEGLVRVHGVTVSHLASECLCRYTDTAVNGEHNNNKKKKKEKEKTPPSLDETMQPCRLQNAS